MTDGATPAAGAAARAGSGPSRRWIRAIAVAALAAGGLYAYGPVLSFLVRQWWHTNVYSYGFFIPAISAYLVWLKRDEIRALPRTISWGAGGAVAAAALLLLLAGQVSGAVVLQEFSLIAAVAGGTLLLFGPRIFRAALFPIGYLTFMLPIWGTLAGGFHVPFQWISATLGTALLHLLGVPVHREGLVLHLPRVSLEVADVCSGVNYLISVVAIGIPVARLWIRGWTRRVALLAFAVVVAIATNGLRVGFIGVLVHFGYAGDIHGPGHVLQGIMISLVGFAALYAGAALLRRSEQGSERSAGETKAPAEPVPWNAAWTAPAFAFAALLALSGAAALAPRPEPIRLSRPLATLTESIGPWMGRESSRLDSLFAALPADEAIYRVYHTAGGDSVGLYVGYWSSQTQGREVVDFQLRKLVGSWGRAERGEGEHRFEVARGDFPDERAGKIGLVTFLIGDRVIANPYAAMIYSWGRSAVRGRSNGAVVAVFADYSNSEARVHASERAIEFFELALPQIALQIGLRRIP